MKCPRAAKISMTHVPYKGAGPALTDVAGGQVDFYFPGYPGSVPLVQSGQVKMLAVSTAKRLRDAPNVPTVAEASGMPEFDFTLWAGFFAPRGTPPEIITRTSAALALALKNSAPARPSSSMRKLVDLMVIPPRKWTDCATVVY